MNKFVQTDLSSGKQPIMVVDDKGYAHCVWQKDNVVYTKFNGSSWEYLNDNKFVPIPENGRVVINGLSLNGNNYPHILYAVPKNTQNIWGNDSNLYLVRWDGEKWITESNAVISKIIFGASSIFYNNDLFIAILIKHESNYLLSIVKKQDIYFNQLNTISISSLNNVESGVLLRKVDNSIYCFWNNFDGTTQWIEHVIYYPDGNYFESTLDRKINFSNDSSPITGFDFASLN